MKAQKYSLPIGGISTIFQVPAYYASISCILFLISFPGIQHTYSPGSDAVNTQSFEGTWEIYKVGSNETLMFSHYEKYATNHEFSQWNATFSATGQWWNNGDELCVEFDNPALTICGDTEFEDDNTFYYLENGAPTQEILVCKRKMPVSRPIAPTRLKTTNTKTSPVKSAKTSNPGYKEEVEQVPCNFCYASGKKTCILCYGSGKKTRTVTKYESGRTIYVTEEYNCSACDGKGYNVCAACDGRGELTQVKKNSMKN